MGTLLFALLPLVFIVFLLFFLPIPEALLLLLLRQGGLYIRLLELNERLQLLSVYLVGSLTLNGFDLLR
jgi:hypothetical protein